MTSPTEQREQEREDTPHLPESFRRDFQRAIDESLNRKGMLVGMPKATVDTARLDYLLKLVSDLERQLAAERESCAKVCEEWGAWNETAQAIAAAIRARGGGR